MNEYTHNKKGNMADMILAERASGPAVQSQALKEIIDVLRYPFQTSCDTCNGLGFIRNGQDCPTCDGSGKVIDDFFK